MSNKLLIIFVSMIFMLAAILPVTGELNKLKTEEIKGNINDEYPLPPPISVDMILEESICRRMSVRSFTSEAVTDEELSTILWAAYGYANNGNRTIFSPNGVYPTIIYVIRSDATYKYVPENHSLSLFKTGNYLYLGQYDTANIKFGLVWDKNIESDEMLAMAQIGMIGQNIYFDANALDLGTVTTGMYVNELLQLGLPSNEKPEIIMPLGHPSSPYDFTYDPLPISNLPMIENGTLSLEDATNNRDIVNNWDNIPLTLFEESQLIWCSYGNSYLLDSLNDRHRTLPSAIDIYPFKVFAANQSGVYQYQPSTHSITTILQDDRREEINNSIESYNINVPSASWIIIPCLDTNVGSSQYLTFWYYEVGAITHNVLLEATALNLGANVVTDISNEAGLRSALGISSQTNLLPWAVIPVGHPFYENPNNPPQQPNITGTTNGNVGVEYDYNFVATDPDGDNIYYYIQWGDGTNTGWLGPYMTGENIIQSHTWSKKGTYNIRCKAKDIYDDESSWGSLQVTMPRSKTNINSLLFKLIKQFPLIEVLCRSTLENKHWGNKDC